MPTYILAKMNETPDTFFKSYIFTKSHDKAIRAVAERIVDGAAVDSLIWEYANRTNPVFTSRTRVLRKSDPYGIPPVVVPRDLAKDLKQKLKGVFLNAHQDEQGRAILTKMMIDRFVVVEDSDLSIRPRDAILDHEAQDGRKEAALAMHCVFGLRLKILIGTSAIVLVFGLCVLVFGRLVLYEKLHAKLEKRGISMARSLAQQCVTRRY